MERYADMVTEINGAVNNVDIAMSQIFNFGNENLDDMDRAMSQIVTENSFGNENLDDMDRTMSQMVVEGDFETFVAPEGVFGDKVVEEKIDNDDDGVSAEVYAMDSNSVDGSDGLNIQTIEEGSDDIPLEIVEAYEKAMADIIPKKSGKRYLQAYDVFVKWQKSMSTSSFDEKVVMAYFSMVAENYKSSTLWSKYSMLRSTILWKHNIDISKYSQLIAWLKRQNEGYESKQSNVFTSEEISRFVVEAPNISYLAMKAILGFGIIGVLRGDELTKLKFTDVKDTGDEIIVRIPTSKTKKPKMNVIDGEFTNIIRQYIKLRPTEVTTNRMFLQYRDGKCVNQVIGKNYIAKIPKKMAEFLQLPNPQSYTGHSYRRTGTTIAANSGANIEQLKKIGDWKSASVCEKYIQESVGQKRKLGKLISGAIDLPSTVISGSVSASTKIPKIENNHTASGATNLPSTVTSGSVSSSTNFQKIENNHEVSAAINSPSTESTAGSISLPVIKINQAVSNATDALSCVTSVVNTNISSPPVSSGDACSPLATAAGLPQSTTSVGMNLPTNANIVFHFAGECKTVTVLNMK